MPIRIIHLCELPDFRATVARWIYEEFWADKDRHSPSSLEKLLQQATSADGLPISLLALQDDAPVGTVNLIENDDEDRSHLGPWLAALLVLPTHRRQGFGSALIGSLQGHAARLGFRGMYLGTDNPAFYVRRGATVHEQVGDNFCIMYLRAAGASAVDG
jgi:predicted N-acetyltransferase YhbS